MRDSCVAAEALTIPLDTAKVRLQLQSKSEGPPKYRGLIGTIGTVAKEEARRSRCLRSLLLAGRMHRPTGGACRASPRSGRA